jgi:hypothetical protein
MTKRCSTCQETKPLDFFNKNKSTKTGYHNQCRECVKLWKPSPEALKESRRKTREWNRLKSTGFTPEDFKSKLEEQGGVCAICGTDNPGKLDFCADHDHATQTKRGVLCRKCNAGLGHFNDNPETIAKAIEYLSHYTK